MDFASLFYKRERTMPMKKKPLADPWLFTTDEDKEKTYRLETSKDLDPLMERIGDAHFVLLGEASHGTHEYYTWRSAITRRLVKEKGFRFIAVEGGRPTLRTFSFAPAVPLPS